MWLSKVGCIILSIMLVQYVKYMSNLQQCPEWCHVFPGSTLILILANGPEFPIPNV